jgi:hypothetical protein
MAISVFLSTVSDEFRAYRDQLRDDLDRHDVSVKVQEQFKDLGGDTLDKLDVHIAHCDAVVHLVGDMCGASTDVREQSALVAKHSDLQSKLPPLGEALKSGVCLPYTQWEAWLALYHGKPLLIAKAKTAAPRGPRFATDDASRAAQVEHLERLEGFHRYPGCGFANPDDLAKQIAYSAILDLLVTHYAENAAREREVAEGFIREMAKRVAGDAALDLGGMKQAVRNAIEIYEKEIAGSPPRQTSTTSSAARWRTQKGTLIEDNRGLRARRCSALPMRCSGRKKNAANVIRRVRPRSTIAPETSRLRPITAAKPLTRSLGWRDPFTARAPPRSRSPEFGGAFALRLWSRSRKQCASQRRDRCAA